MILIVPIGPVPIYLLSWLESRLGLFLQRPVSIGRAVPFPKKGYSRSRRQQKGEAVMELLAAIPAPGAERIVGIIDQDCYNGEFNFVFGQAAAGGRQAFVALPRLRQGFYGLEENKDLFRQRVLKEIIHELGHTWGLGHCPDPGCVMRFSNTLQDTDRKEARFCDTCREKLNL